MCVRIKKTTTAVVRQMYVCMHLSMRMDICVLENSVVWTNSLQNWHDRRVAPLSLIYIQLSASRQNNNKAKQRGEGNDQERHFSAGSCRWSLTLRDRRSMDGWSILASATAATVAACCSYCAGCIRRQSPLNSWCRSLASLTLDTHNLYTIRDAMTNACRVQYPATINGIVCLSRAFSPSSYIFVCSRYHQRWMCLAARWVVRFPRRKATGTALLLRVDRRRLQWTAVNTIGQWVVTQLRRV